MANLLIPYENPIIFSQFMGKYNSKFVIQIHVANRLDFVSCTTDQASAYQSDLSKNVCFLFFSFFFCHKHEPENSKSSWNKQNKQKMTKQD